MIFTEYTDNLYFGDIFLHLQFSFIIVSVVFHLLFRKSEKERIDKVVKDVLETNIFSGLSVKSSSDIDNLKILKKIYSNEDFFDKSIHYLKKNSWTSLIIICVVTIIFILQVKNEPKIFSLLLDKMLLFACIGIILYLQESFISSKFNILFEKDIYEILNNNIKNLKSTTTY